LRFGHFQKIIPYCDWSGCEGACPPHELDARASPAAEKRQSEWRQVQQRVQPRPEPKQPEGGWENGQNVVK